MNETASVAEKRWAALTHLATIPAPFIAPLVSIAVNRKSRFVCAHAMQALYEHIIWKALLAIGIVCSFAYSLSRLWHHYQTDWKEFSLTEFIVRFLVGFLILSIIAAVNIVQSVWAAHKAHRGDWPKNGRLVRGVLNRTHGTREALEAPPLPNEQV